MLAKCVNFGLHSEVDCPSNCIIRLYFTVQIIVSE